MEDAITVEFTPAASDRAEAMVYAYQRDWNGPVRFGLSRGPIAALTAVLIVLYVTGQLGAREAIAPSILLGLLVLLSAPAVRTLAGWWPSHSSPGVSYPARITFTAAGLTIHGEAGDAWFSWSAARDVVASGRAVIVDLDGHGRAIIPARAFASFDEYRTFAGVIQTWHFDVTRHLPPEALPAH